MNTKNFFGILLSISVFLLIPGCTGEADQVAISADGVEISFHQEGKGEPALVFIHGWANNRSIWDTLVPHFSGKYKVVTIDLAGYGASGNNRNEWTIQAFGEDVAAVVNKMKLNKVVLAGFSLGGPVVIEAANTLQDQVTGVVLVDALKDIEQVTPIEAFPYVDSMMMDLVINPSAEKAKWFFRNNLEESFNKVISIMFDNNPKIGWSESLYAMMKWSIEDCTESLSRIHVPVTAINTDQEPTNEEALRKYIPSFKAHIVPDVGHVIMWDAPEEFNRLFEECVQGFLNE